MRLPLPPCRPSIVAVLALLALAAAPARAAEEHAAPLSPALLDAVVHVETRVPAEARTAGLLGTERQGSGVVIDDDGLIVTIGYLVMEAMAAEITTRDGKPVLAAIVGFDNESGLGLLRAQEKLAVKPIRIGSAKGVAVETPVLLAAAGRAQPAKISSRRPFAGFWEYLIDDAIFTTPPLTDWSGAALIGEDGKLLGIGSLLVGNAGESGGPLPGNLFVPIDLLEPALGDLLTAGRPQGAPRPWLGLYLAPTDRGFLVLNVSTGGPAEKAGLSRGDRIVAVAGERVTGLAAFWRKLWAQGDAGVTVPLTIEQDGARRDIDVPSVDRYRYLKLNTSY